MDKDTALINYVSDLQAKDEELMNDVGELWAKNEDCTMLNACSARKTAGRPISKGFYELGLLPESGLSGEATIR